MILRYFLDRFARMLAVVTQVKDRNEGTVQAIKIQFAERLCDRLLVWSRCGGDCNAEVLNKFENDEIYLDR